MSDATEYYQRGLSFLSEKPPNLIKALSLIRKAKFLFDQKNNERESEAAQDKIHYIYMSITENEFELAKNLLTVASYEKALAKAINAYAHLEKSHPKYTQKTLKKIQNLIEQIGIELLYDIERNQTTISINESLSKLHYVVRVILEIFYPQLKPVGDSADIPESFINELQDKHKIQRAFINTYESLGNLAKKQAEEEIAAGNITQAVTSVEIAKKLYQIANFPNRINDLQSIFQKIYETQGDLAYTYAEKLIEDNRLEKARHQLKRSSKLYNLSLNDKKEKVSKERYLEISVDLGNLFLEDAEKARQLGDLKSAVDYLKQARDFFQTINHKNFLHKTDIQLNLIYTILGDRESEMAEQFDPHKMMKDFLNQLQSDEYSFQSEFFITSEIISQKLQKLHGAFYYYQKAQNDIQFKKIERKIQSYTEQIANLYLNQGKRDIKNREYEKAHIHLKKSMFHFQNDDRRLNDVRSMIQKIQPKINSKKLEQINNSLIRYNELVSEQMTDHTPKTHATLPGDIPDQQFRCKNCGSWVPAYYYDSIQERCIECRAKIHCDECRKEIGPNEIFQKCSECTSVFCLNCAERVYDFIQKKCLSCRTVQICDFCQKEAKTTENFQHCSQCGKVCCSEHFDFQQDLCKDCRKTYRCKQCGIEVYPEDAFMCDTCEQSFCVQHFDVGRKTCLQDRKEVICAKCGRILKKEEPANKCDNCGFMYCMNHYSEFHDMCLVCLPKLECNTCNRDLSKEKFFRCTDCLKVFCNSHFKSFVGRCITCAEKMSGTTLVTVSSSFTTQDPSEMYDLQANTLQPIIQKYDAREFLESEEISFLLQHQINLPSDEEKYLTIGEMDKKMVLIRDPSNKPYVVLVPETPIQFDVKYYGDLFRKLIAYLPEVPETIDGITSIVNLVFYAANNPRWALLYKMLSQTLLKTGIEVLQVLVLIFRKMDVDLISKTISDSVFVDVFSGTNIQDAIKFIQTNDSEDEVGVFSNNDRLDDLLKVFYNVYRGNILRAAEILAIYEFPSP